MEVSPSFTRGEMGPRAMKQLRQDNVLNLGQGHEKCRGFQG